MADLSGRVAVVTGAGTGIGRAIALRLAEQGAAVGLIGRRESPLAEVAAQAGPARVVAADVSRRGAVDAAFAEIAAELGPLHIVVANAGAGGPNQDGPEDRWDEILRANLDGAYYCLRAFMRHMAPPTPAEPTESGARRHAVVISSCVARFGTGGISAYSAAKAGQLGLVRALAVEWAPQVLVNAICPGWVETQMAADRMREIGEAQARAQGRAPDAGSAAAARAELIGALPLQRISQPEEIAALVEFLCSPGAAAFTGQAFDPNNGAWMG
ncbi:MAG: SDR family NAD(P)-dependent oxidoreductase [Deltaproteobacteria bacterium]|nr:SDR family NAD(P)-dependent oxidoreductase [Deltaproteobacteria bacterium]